MTAPAPFNKYFYAQFGKEINQEAAELQAHSEAKEVSFAKCDHKKVRFENDQLRCSCGVAWSGPGMARLYDLLTSGNIG